MKLKRIQKNTKKAAGNKKKTESVLSAMTPGLCVDFHPIVSWPQKSVFIGTFKIFKMI